LLTHNYSQRPKEVIRRSKRNGKLTSIQSKRRKREKNSPKKARRSQSHPTKGQLRIKKRQYEKRQRKDRRIKKRQ
jgi:hypothetical protein